MFPNPPVLGFHGQNGPVHLNPTYHAWQPFHPQCQPLLGGGEEARQNRTVRQWGGALFLSSSAFHLPSLAAVVSLMLCFSKIKTSPMLMTYLQLKKKKKKLFPKSFHFICINPGSLKGYGYWRSLHDSIGTWVPLHYSEREVCEGLIYSSTFRLHPPAYCPTPTRYRKNWSWTQPQSHNVNLDMWSSSLGSNVHSHFVPYRQY